MTKDTKQRQDKAMIKLSNFIDWLKIRGKIHYNLRKVKDSPLFKFMNKERDHKEYTHRRIDSTDAKMSIMDEKVGGILSELIRRNEDANLRINYLVTRVDALEANCKNKEEK